MPGDECSDCGSYERTPPVDRRLPKSLLVSCSLPHPRSQWSSGCLAVARAMVVKGMEVVGWRLCSQVDQPGCRAWRVCSFVVGARRCRVRWRMDGVQRRNEKWVAGILMGRRVHVSSFAWARMEVRTRRSPGARWPALLLLLLLLLPCSEEEAWRCLGEEWH